MFGLSRMSVSLGLGSDRLGEALLNLGFLRAGLSRGPRLEELPDHLRRDVGLQPLDKGVNPRDLR